MEDHCYQRRVSTRSWWLQTRMVLGARVSTFVVLDVHVHHLIWGIRDYDIIMVDRLGSEVMSHIVCSEMKSVATCDPPTPTMNSLEMNSPYHSVCMYFLCMPGPVEERPTVRRKNVRPPKYHIHRSPQSEAINKPSSLSSLHRYKPQSESTVKAQMPYWYRPQFSRKEASSFVRSLDPGSFIVRDSTTFPGSYAITIKISPKQIRQRRKMTEGIMIIISLAVWQLLYCGNFLRD